MRKFTSQEIREFVSRPLFDEKIVLNKDPSWPKISIVTPSYNQAEFLERTILSVLNQNYPNLEYIIIDGGSTDGSVEIIRKYEKYLSYWISEHDQGAADAISKGFNFSSGEILAWIGADDLYLPEVLMKIGNIYKHSKFDMCYGNVLAIDSNDDIICELRSAKYLKVYKENIIINCLFSIYQPSMFFSKMAYLSVGGLDKSLKNVFDNDLIIKFLLSRINIKFIREFIACERHHKNRRTFYFKEVSKKEMMQLKKSYGKKAEITLIDKIQFYLIKLGVFTLQGDLFWLLNKLYKKYSYKIN